jgi:NAD+ kinase
MTVRVRWMRGGQVMAETMAMNDVVLLKEYESRMIHFTMRQGETLLSSFAADGLILSTPTGATAYNLSAGGPIVYPTMQLLIATAICPHTLTARPMILPPTPAVNMEFKMRHASDRGQLWIDGQVRWPIAEGDVIAVEADPQPLRLIVSDSSQYFATLRRKLCWSGEPPARPENNGRTPGAEPAPGGAGA